MRTYPRWSIEKANEWYERQPWLVGCNFIPSNAINQLEMWQAETFDPFIINCELSLAASLGFNTVRTYLHDLAWQADREGFKERINCFLEIAARHRIRPILVIFDDCWNANPVIGPQPAPKPGVHNSGWVQSPGIDINHCCPSIWEQLETYVTDVLRTFAHDERILMWDLYNEPGNSHKGDTSLRLLEAVFSWARAVDPSQPLTAGLWFDNKKLNDFQLAASDIITFHNYRPVDELEREIAGLRVHGRPIICTEWMARTVNCLVKTNLPVFARERVGCLNWGLVAGKTNTIYAWKTTMSVWNPRRWFPAKSASISEPLWFHDLFHQDGTPYDVAEIEIIKRYTLNPERRPCPFPQGLTSGPLPTPLPSSQ